MPPVSVIVPARDAESTLPRTLAALAGQEGVDDFEVIVVDDGSRDGTVVAARQAGGNVKVLVQEPSGPAAARNRGVNASSAAALAFCDADCYPTPGWLAAGLAALERAELVQGHVLPDPGATVGPFDRTLWVTHEVGLYETANLFVTREVFDRIGGFEEWIRPGIGKAIAEDVWFGWRARRHGARSGFSAEALAHHAVFPRGPRAYVAERLRLVYFPAMAAQMPELRKHFFYRRWFLNRRSAAFDLAVGGAVAALLKRSPLTLVAALPYARIALDRTRRCGSDAPIVAAADLAADLVALASLAVGSVRSRSLLL
jgi:glycosyltransferase involved in cell wall biosynthesis